MSINKHMLCIYSKIYCVISEIFKAYNTHFISILNIYNLNMHI